MRRYAHALAAALERVACVLYICVNTFSLIYAKLYIFSVVHASGPCALRERNEILVRETRTPSNDATRM